MERGALAFFPIFFPAKEGSLELEAYLDRQPEFEKAWIQLFQRISTFQESRLEVCAQLLEVFVYG